MLSLRIVVASFFEKDAKLFRDQLPRHKASVQRVQRLQPILQLAQ
jgi:hypothetical protein